MKIISPALRNAMNTGPVLCHLKYDTLWLLWSLCYDVIFCSLLLYCSQYYVSTVHCI